MRSIGNVVQQLNLLHASIVNTNYGDQNAVRTIAKIPWDTFPIGSVPDVDVLDFETGFHHHLLQNI